MYLAKIYNENDNDYEQDTNLLSVLLLNPKNDEALYLLRRSLLIKQYNSLKIEVNLFDMRIVLNILIQTIYYSLTKK